MSEVKAKPTWWSLENWSWLLALPLGFSTSTFQVFAIDTAGFTLADIGCILFGGLCIYRAVTGQRAMILRLDLSMVLLLVMFAIMLISSLSPLLSGSRPQVMQYLKSSSHFSYMWFFTVCCASIPMNLDLVLRAIRAFCLVAIPVNIFGIYQVPARAFNLPLAWIKTTNISIGGVDQLSLGYEGFFRATSVFSEPSVLAFFTILVAIFLLVPYLMYDVRILRSRILFYLSLYSTFIAMFLTFSLTIVAQLSAFIFVLLLISRQSNVRKMLQILGTIVLVFILSNKAVATFSSTDVFDLYFRRIAANVLGGEKIETTMGDSFGTRANAQKSAISVWKQYPLVGVGFGCLLHAKAADGERHGQAFQAYLYALATTGLFGGLCVFALAISLTVNSFRLFFRYRRENRTVDSTQIVVAIVPFIASNQLVFGFTSDNLIVAYSWILLGIVASVLYHPRFRRLEQTAALRFELPQHVFSLRPAFQPQHKQLSGEVL